MFATEICWDNSEFHKASPDNTVEEYHKKLQKDERDQEDCHGQDE
jgi:hypothetical protein